jgi:hypothetical protein
MRSPLRSREHAQRLLGERPRIHKDAVVVVPYYVDDRIAFYQGVLLHNSPDRDGAFGVRFPPTIVHHNVSVVQLSKRMVLEGIRRVKQTLLCFPAILFLQSFFSNLSSAILLQQSFLSNPS